MEPLSGFAPVVGLEVHAQLRTATKIFCGCRNAYGEEPNTLVCPVCGGLPGALPVLGEAAVAMALRAGLALGCRINGRSLFARKNYFYPDVPKNYQITQYEEPLCTGGALAFPWDEGERTCRLERIHLEEDAAKLIHTQRGTLVDLNRAGTPLLEIVTRPELTGGAEAQAFLRRLRQVLVYLEVCDGNLEEGSLRCDANVSLRPAAGAGGERAGAGAGGARVELKNLNSLGGVRRAIEHEVARQSERLRRGETVVTETRGWDAAAGRTHPLRGKETAPDYRYFPEPDLPPLVVTETEVAAARASLPELPADRERRLLAAHDLARDDVRILCDTPALADYFERTATALGDGRLAGTWIVTGVLGILNARGIGIADFPVAPRELAALLALLADGTIGGPAAREVLAEMVETGAPAAAIVGRRGLRQVADEAELRPVVQGVLDAHPEQVRAWRDGKTTLMTWFVGQVMRATRGRAAPAVVRRLLDDELPRRRV